MSVRLHLYRIRVIEVMIDLPERLEVVVRDLRSVVRCPWCSFKTSKVHETRRVKVKDLARGTQKVTLIWLRRRFECTNCGERHTETHPAFDKRMTARLTRAIVRDARHLSITEIGRRYVLSWHTVMAVVKQWSALLAERRAKRPCRVLLVDETSLRRRHRYVTVISNGETGEVIGIVRHRDFRALSGFLTAQGRRWCAKVEVVVTDGSPSYRGAIERHLGHASHVVDRFHVGAHLVDGRSRPGEQERRGRQQPPHAPDAPALSRQRIRPHRLDAGRTALVRGVPAVHIRHRNPSGTPHGNLDRQQRHHCRRLVCSHHPGRLPVGERGLQPRSRALVRFRFGCS